MIYFFVWAIAVAAIALIALMFTAKSFESFILGWILIIIAFFLPFYFYVNEQDALCVAKGGMRISTQQGIICATVTELK